MKYFLEVLAEAEQQLTDAYDYYESKQDGLGKRFVDHIGSYFVKIVQNPKLYQEKNPPNREAFTQSFPYVIIYRIENDMVIVLSVFHTSQNPDKKP